jgi:hypothetical protein
MTTALKALALAGASALAFATTPALSQDETIYPANAATVDYGALNALPDWRGMWLPSGRSTLDGGAEPQLTEDYRHTYENYQAAVARGENPELNERTSNCLPPGMPAVMTQPYNVMFVFAPGKVRTPIPPSTATRSAIGRATRSSSRRSASRKAPVSDASASSTPAT